MIYLDINDITINQSHKVITVILKPINVTHNSYRGGGGGSGKMKPYNIYHHRGKTKEF